MMMMVMMMMVMMTQSDESTNQTMNGTRCKANPESPRTREAESNEAHKRQNEDSGEDYRQAERGGL
jgi:hypothetical protein